MASVRRASPTQLRARVNTARTAFSSVELLVVIAIIVVLFAIMVPTVAKVRHRSYVDACAGNLRQLGEAMAAYAADHGGALPRGTYVPGLPPRFGTASNNVERDDARSAAPNDVTAALHLLRRSQDLPASLLVCPFTDAPDFEPDFAPPDVRAGFTDYRRNLGYSVANPYPSLSASMGGYAWSVRRLGADFALMADLNPGVRWPDADVFAAAGENAPRADVESSNSRNHGRSGQNVLYADGHVEWQQTPLCGPRNGGTTTADNIYTTRAGQLEASPFDRDDCVLLPAQD